jgi:hypothetical protein
VKIRFVSILWLKPSISNVNKIFEQWSGLWHRCRNLSK